MLTEGVRFVSPMSRQIRNRTRIPNMASVQKGAGQSKASCRKPPMVGPIIGAMDIPIAI